MRPFLPSCRIVNWRHETLDHFARAVHHCKQAGFRPRNMELNALILYGLPGETIDAVVKTILYLSDLVGSIIPMLFAPVTTTQVYQEHLP